jgi:sirohydrochlorin cobaltochelatase
VRPPLLVVGHGTRDAAGVAEFARFLDRLALLAGPDLPVAGGFLELAAPPVADAVADLVAAGHRRLVAVPLVLVAAGHAKGDVPAALARERVRHPGLRFDYGRPLGAHPTVLELLTQRLDAVLDQALRPDTMVLLVGRGSTDPDANAELGRAARLLWEGRRLAGVEYAFVSLAEPGVAAGLDRCRALGARRVVVLPFFLFPGVLPDRVADQSAAWGDAHPDVEVRVAAVIGDCAELAALVVERYAEAVAGEARANCDACQYRVALPGFAHRVGAPQRPHDHPHDPVLAHSHPHPHPHGHDDAGAPHAH